MIISIIYVHLRLARFYFCRGADPETSRISDVFCLSEVLLNSGNLAGFPLDLENLENLENESTPGKPGNIMEFWKI